MKYGEIKHFSHPHILQLQDSKRLYTCDGCRQHGFGLTYRCSGCNYDLHRECTVDRYFTISHPFFVGYKFELLESPLGIRSTEAQHKGLMWDWCCFTSQVTSEPSSADYKSDGRVCDACELDIEGFVYHCKEKGWDLHPCCAKLERVIMITDEQVELHLRGKVSSKCNYCGVKRLREEVGGWSYVSSCNQFHFHVACIKEAMVNAHENNYFEANGQITVIGSALMVPSRELVKYNSEEGGKKWLSKYLRIAKVVIKSVISILLGNFASPVVDLVAALLQSG